MANNHEIGGGLTERELGIASFWVRNRLWLRRMGYGSLAVFTVAIWGFVAWSLLDAYVISYPREKQITNLIIQNALAVTALQATAPAAVQPSEVRIFDSTDMRQDFLVELVNPNAQWWTEFTYQFETGGELTPERKGYLLPQEPRFLTEIGWKGTPRAINASLRVSNVVWHRIDPSGVERDYRAFRDRRMQLAFENVTYKSDLQINDKTISQTSFLMKNNSAFGFWSLDLAVILYRANDPIAVTHLNIRELKPGESRPISINWFENVSGVSKTDISPSVNLLDPNIYLPSERF